MGDGTKEKPLTRKDVLRLIKENGGTAEGLDLSGQIFKKGINLRKLDLSGIILKQAILEEAHLEGAKLRNAQLRGARLAGAYLEQSSLSNAHLEEAELFRAHLEESSLWKAHLEGSWLFDAHVQRAALWGAHLEGAHLIGAQFEGALLRLAKFSYDTELTNIDWGNYILAEENLGDFKLAADTYRHLKIWHNNLGIYDVAGEFFFREMTAKRNYFWWGDVALPIGDLSYPIKLKKFPKVLFPRKLFHWAWYKFMSLICGYGERPIRVIGWAASVVLGLALVYFLIGSTWEWWAFWNALYFSAVSFTALGYGSWLTMTNSWIQGIGAFESFIGVFTIALFLITFVRKMTR